MKIDLKTDSFSEPQSTIDPFPLPRFLLPQPKPDWFVICAHSTFMRTRRCMGSEEVQQCSFVCLAFLPKTSRAMLAGVPRRWSVTILGKTNLLQSSMQPINLDRACFLQQVNLQRRCWASNFAPVMDWRALYLFSTLTHINLIMFKGEVLGWSFGISSRDKECSYGKYLEERRRKFYLASKPSEGGRQGSHFPYVFSVSLCSMSVVR